MNEMLETIIPKSDQLNADDLLGGRTRTIKISRVSILAGEQPVALHYEGDNGKPYKPCKSMRRVIVTVWGPDANLYVGRRMTLYRDENVMFGGVAVAGIRISHISGIDSERTIALTASRAIRKPFTVRQLTDEPDAANLLDAGTAAANAGMAPLQAFWKGLSAAERHKIGQAQLEAWKHFAATGTDLSQFPASPTPAPIDLQDRRDTGNASSPLPVSDPANSLALDMMSEIAARKIARNVGLDKTNAPAETHLDELLSEGRGAATDGAKAFKTWHARLNQADAEMIQPYADGLKKVASQADELRT